jgi:hypothetical protein
VLLINHSHIGVAGPHKHHAQNSQSCFNSEEDVHIGDSKKKKVAAKATHIKKSSGKSDTTKKQQQERHEKKKSSSSPKNRINSIAKKKIATHVLAT